VADNGTEIAEPRISVVMAAYNAAEHLSGAIDSILGQTFENFELIVIDDGSKDDTSAIIHGYADPRLRPVRNPHNLGLIASLNRGLDLARGEFIARMDADDEALPRRFEEQIRFLDAHPEIGLCGTAIETFGVRTERWALECEPARVRCQMLFDPGLSHPTVMFRRSILLQHDLRYDPAYLHAEDYALWVRFAAVAQVANLPSVLLRYRLHPHSVSHNHRDTQRRTADRVRREQVQRLGIEPTERQMTVHATLMRGAPHTLTLGLDETEAWLSTLLEANRRTGFVEQKVLSSMLYEKWFRLCRAHRPQTRSIARRFLMSSVGAEIPWLKRLADGLRLLVQ
jgi:glycosyltransferase involved in cell wall biosynthesis